MQWYIQMEENPISIEDLSNLKKLSFRWMYKIEDCARYN